MKIEERSHYFIGPVRIWTSSKDQPHIYVEVQNGIVKDISTKKPSQNIPVIDGHGFVLMPSGVDAQVHLRVPGQEKKEIADTGLRSAMRGGYSALLTMPNTNPTIDNVQTLKLGQQLTSSFEKAYGVQVVWSAAITRNLSSSILTPIEDLAQAGIRALTNDGLGVLSDSVMDEAFARLSGLDIPLLQHAEFLGHGGSLAPSKVQQAVGAKPYPVSAELDMLERDLRVLRHHPKARYHLLHMTSRKALPMIQDARQSGLRVTCEVTPHHLYFCGDEIDPSNTSFKMNPPLRDRADKDSFWKGLESGEIDFVSTDHAPHEPQVKKGKFDDVAFGTVGMETALRVLVWGYQTGKISSRRLVETFSLKPAQFLRLDDSYGDISVGHKIRAVLVDVDAPARRVYESDFVSQSKNSCFIGSELPGRIVSVFHEQREINLY